MIPELLSGCCRQVGFWSFLNGFVTVSFGNWKPHHEASAGYGTSFGPKIAFAIEKSLSRKGKPQAKTVSLTNAGKRLEESSPCFFSYSRSRIFNCNQYRAAVRISGDLDFSPLRHRVNGIADQVNEDALEAVARGKYGEFTGNVDGNIYRSKFGGFRELVAGGVGQFENTAELRFRAF